MLKHLTKSAAVAWFASFLIGSYIRLVSSTSRWEFIGREHFDHATENGAGVIMAFWHGRMMMVPMIRKQTDKRVFMLISNHRDGEIIANGVKSFGVEFIRGSTANPKKPEKNKSGASAITQMVAALEDGNVVGITPDGPRGPGEQSQKGIIRLAQMSKAMIVPAAYSTSNGRHLTTWDRFLIPLPFSRGVFMAGPPIKVPLEKDAQTLEITRLTVEKALLEVTELADKKVGRKID